jgi:hypothetical protein
MNKPTVSAFHWVVDFRIRSADKRQGRMIDLVGPRMLYGLAGLWLEVLAPAARELERDEMAATRRIAFPTRAGARRFRSAWGGRLERLVIPILEISQS